MATREFADFGMALARTEDPESTGETGVNYWGAYLASLRVLGEQKNAKTTLEWDACLHVATAGQESVNGDRAAPRPTHVYDITERTGPGATARAAIVVGPPAPRRDAARAGRRDSAYMRPQSAMANESGSPNRKACTVYAAPRGVRK